jgi:WD40 repeat protein
VGIALFIADRFDAYARRTTASPTVALPFGTQIGAPLARHPGGVSHLAYDQINGRPVVVSIGENGTVSIWDLDRRREIGTPLEVNTKGGSAAYGRIGGRPVIVAVGGDDKTLRVWDLTGRRQIGSPMSGHTGFIASVVCGELDGRPIAITGGGSTYWNHRTDNTVRIWDLTRYREIGKPLTGHPDIVTPIAYGSLDGRPIAISAAEPVQSADARMRVWDLAEQRQIGEPFGRVGVNGAINDIAYGRLGGRSVAITASQDHTVRVWDLADHRQIGAPMTGHTDYVASVAYGELGGRPIVISGGGRGDRTVRVWDLATHRRIGPTLTGNIGSIDGVVYGRLGGNPVAIGADENGTISAWSLGPPYPSPTPG